MENERAPDRSYYKSASITSNSRKEVQSWIWLYVHWLSKHTKRRIHPSKKATNQEPIVRMSGSVHLQNIFTWSVLFSSCQDPRTWGKHILTADNGRGSEAPCSAGWVGIQTLLFLPGFPCFTSLDIPPSPERRVTSLSFWSTSSQATVPAAVGYSEIHREASGAPQTLALIIIQNAS